MIIRLIQRNNSKIKNVLLIAAIACMLSACGKNGSKDLALTDLADSIAESTSAISSNDDQDSEMSSSDQSSDVDQDLESSSSDKSADELIDAFLAGEIPAYYFSAIDRYDMGEDIYKDNEPQSYMVTDYITGEDDGFSYEIECREDIDEDGEEELILQGMYGECFFDAKDDRVNIVAEPYGTAGMLGHTKYNDATWIVLFDTTHVGRQLYDLYRLDGDENVVEHMDLSAEYWDKEDGMYDETSDFTFNGKKITMRDFELLRDEIINGKETEEEADEDISAALENYYSQFAGDYSGTVSDISLSFYSAPKESEIGEFSLTDYSGETPMTLSGHLFYVGGRYKNRLEMKFDSDGADSYMEFDGKLPVENGKTSMAIYDKSLNVLDMFVKD